MTYVEICETIYEDLNIYLKFYIITVHISIKDFNFKYSSEYFFLLANVDCRSKLNSIKLGKGYKPVNSYNTN